MSEFPLGQSGEEKMVFLGRKEGRGWFSGRPVRLSLARVDACRKCDDIGDFLKSLWGALTYSELKKFGGNHQGSPVARRSLEAIKETGGKGQR